MARVLVVDDAAFMRKMVTDALSKGGHEVVGEGANGEEAVDVLVNGRLFATGRIVLVEDEWAVRIEEVLGDAADLPIHPSTSIERS